MTYEEGLFNAMDTVVCQGSIFQQTAEVIVLGHYEEETLDERLAPLLEVSDFQGKAKETLLLYPRGAIPAKRAVLVGLGKRQEMTLNGIRQFGAQARHVAQKHQLNEFHVELPIISDMALEDCLYALVEGAELANYQTAGYKSVQTPEESHMIERMTIMTEAEMKKEIADYCIFQAQVIAEGTNFARSLANMPGNTLSPAHLANTAVLLTNHYDLEVTVLKGKELEHFGGLLAVGKGSVHPPQFIIVEYGTAQEDIPTICLVGKGITFDSGGISIKSAEKMDEMKMDMSGAATVLGTMQTIALIKPPIHVVGLISAAENMPSGSAYRPGDLIKTLSGKVVEVLNTDAEGRIVLADALYYAQRYKPQAIIDIATLTGAIVVALGPHAIGMMGNDQPLMDRLIRSGTITHERVWQLPLWNEYKEMIKSDIADIKNIGKSGGGSITAAAFLAAFVGEYAWAHLDIAGTAWTEKPAYDYIVKGATGVGVRLLTHLLQGW